MYTNGSKLHYCTTRRELSWSSFFSSSFLGNSGGSEELNAFLVLSLSVGVGPLDKMIISSHSPEKRDDKILGITKGFMKDFGVVMDANGFLVISWSRLHKEVFMALSPVRWVELVGVGEILPPCEGPVHLRPLGSNQLWRSFHCCR